VKTIDFDINFLNFEDPEVFERLTGPDYEKYWKESYGFDYVAKIDQYKLVGNTKVLDANETPLIKYCVESESR
jgi:hypothetical protein